MARAKQVATKSVRPPRRNFRTSVAGAASTPTGTSNASAASPSTSRPQKARKPHRFRPGTVALREIRHFQRTFKLLIPAAPFIRVVKEITGSFSLSVSRWTAEALVAIQEAAEDYLVQIFEDAMLCAIHAKRVTLSKRLLSRLPVILLLHSSLCVCLCLFSSIFWEHCIFYLVLLTLYRMCSLYIFSIRIIFHKLSLMGSIDLVWPFDE
ncbi:hypothetical protein Syun_013354 [Stephania yunnanensis]|uniref:Core Histone H2A/H2B/H3 domain-containing protein n=1 Tax=Stephania yunnanensis TaxID=152371 RepID=A0AAP0K1X7_9MAGN